MTATDSFIIPAAHPRSHVGSSGNSRARPLRSPPTSITLFCSDQTSILFQEVSSLFLRAAGPGGSLLS